MKSLKDFKLLGEQSDHYVIGHPRGKSIKIPKEGLSSSAHKQIKMMADGGEVSAPESDAFVPTNYSTDSNDFYNGDSHQWEPTPVEQTAEGQQANRAPAGVLDMFIPNKDTIKGAVSSVGDAGASVMGAPDKAPAAKAEQSMPVSNYPIAAQRAPQAASPGLGLGTGYYDKLMQGVGEQKQGLRQEAAAQSAQGQAEAQAAQEHMDLSQQMNQEYQKHSQDLMNEYQNVLKDVRDQHIDPNHYYESKSVPGKIATAVGLIMGGIGGGLTHQENPALKFLNSQIERDVQSQRDELGKKENLLSANMKQFGNLNDATKMTYAMQAGIYSDQLKMAAAKAMDPMAKARLLQASGQIDQQVVAPAMQQLAMQKALYGAMGSSSANPASKISLMQRAGYIDKTSAEQALKELGQAQNHQVQERTIINAFDKANKTNTVAGRASHLGSEPASVGVLQSALMPYLKDAEGRISEVELQRTDKLIPRPGDSPEKVKEKRQGLINFIKEKSATPILDAYGIQVPSLPVVNQR
jgi:hypothetical protein